MSLKLLCAGQRKGITGCRIGSRSRTIGNELRGLDAREFSAIVKDVTDFVFLPTKVGLRDRDRREGADLQREDRDR